MKFMLNVPCVECGGFFEAELPIERDSFAKQLAAGKWFLSVMTMPGQGPEVPLVFGAICPSCAKHVYSPELLKAAEDARDGLLS